nr:hypothetical protein Iba_chr04aCG5210 [Ipomoea batatas]GME13957.1 hypothetical protein Iba_scaffold14888CG0010 [Ipomoea batatas]
MAPSIIHYTLPVLGIRCFRGAYQYSSKIDGKGTIFVFVNNELGQLRYIFPCQTLPSNIKGSGSKRWELEKPLVQESICIICYVIISEIDIISTGI